MIFFTVPLMCFLSLLFSQMFVLNCGFDIYALRKSFQETPANLVQFFKGGANMVACGGSSPLLQSKSPPQMPPQFQTDK